MTDLLKRPKRHWWMFTWGMEPPLLVTRSPGEAETMPFEKKFPLSIFSSLTQFFTLIFLERFNCPAPPAFLRGSLSPGTTRTAYLPEIHSIATRVNINWCFRICRLIKYLLCIIGIKVSGGRCGGGGNEAVWERGMKLCRMSGVITGLVLSSAVITELLPTLHHTTFYPYYDHVKLRSAYIPVA